MLSFDAMDPGNNNFHSELNKLLKHFSVNKNETMLLLFVFFTTLHEKPSAFLNSNLNLISQLLYHQEIRIFSVCVLPKLALYF